MDRYSRIDDHWRRLDNHCKIKELRWERLDLGIFLPQRFLYNKKLYPAQGAVRCVLFWRYKADTLALSMRTLTGFIPVAAVEEVSKNR
jgi:hypothetical protein